MSVLRELQIVELKILKEVVRICEKHRDVYKRQALDDPDHGNRPDL